MSWCSWTSISTTFPLPPNRARIRAVRECRARKTGQPPANDRCPTPHSARVRSGKPRWMQPIPPPVFTTISGSTGNVLSVGTMQLRIDGKLIVIGAGKAASRMAQVVEEMLGDRITGWPGRDQVRARIAAAADSPG